MVDYRLYKIHRVGKYMIFSFTELEEDQGSPDHPRWVLIFHLNSRGFVRLGNAPLGLVSLELVSESRGTQYLNLGDTFGRSKLWVGGFKFLDMDRLDLGPDFSGIEAGYLSRVLGRTGRKLKDVLIDQHVIAGIGDIYGDEVCAVAGVLPYRPANTITADECIKLAESMRSVYSMAVSFGGSTIDSFAHTTGLPGNFQKKFLVFQLKRCSQCGNPTSRVKLGGRWSYYCSCCQH